VLLSIIIPAYNEECTISTIVDAIDRVALKAYDIQKEIIIVDDGSNDRTVEIVEELQRTYAIRLIQHKRNYGKGKALCTGIKAATGEIIIFQDADLEYSPVDYPTLIEPILKNEADVVYGSRFISDRKHTQMRFEIYLCNFLLTKFSNLISGLYLTDMETGYKIFKASAIKQIEILEKRFGVEPEITAKLAKLVRKEGVRVKEVNISYQARTKKLGKKIGWKDGLKAIYCILRYNLFD